MDPPSALLAPEDAEYLRNTGLLVADAPGYKRIHRRRLNRSSDKENADIPLDEPHTPEFLASAFASIPENMISKEAIKYVGLSDDKADELWDKWTNWPSTGPQREVDVDNGGLQVTFSDFVLGHTVYNHPDIASEDDGSWTTYLSLCGFAAAVQEVIMDPVFRYLRLSESAAHWAKDTIRMRFAGLREIQETSRQRQMAKHRQRFRPAGRQASFDGSLAPPPGPASSSSSSVPAPQIREEAQEQEQQEQVSLEDVVAQNAPGYTCLFKGLDQARTSDLFDSSGTLRRLSTLLSSPPSDFSAATAMFSFTADIKVAKYYAAYAKRRANCEAAFILCLRIPNTAIESLSPPDIERLF